jgi:HlyD family secretion protein
VPRKTRFGLLVIPALAVAGIGVALFSVFQREKPPLTTTSAPGAPAPPFMSWIAGSGIVEANTTNVPIGTPVSGVVSQVFVQSGSDVAAGDPLFAIDDRAQRQAVRVEEAAVAVEEARMAEAEYELHLAASLRDSSTISAAEYDRKHLVFETTVVELTLAREKLRAAETVLAMLTIRAPFPGRILRLAIHPGQFAGASPAAGSPQGFAASEQQALIIFGSVQPLHLRVDLDETECWRFRPGAQAVAFLRANPDISTPLTFVRTEPQVVPKTSLTGRSAERVDARVLQAVYSFERGDLPILVGQQMDVFIEVAPRSAEVER